MVFGQPTITTKYKYILSDNIYVVNQLSINGDY